MPDLNTIMQQEPEPTITIRCHKVAATGSPSHFGLQPGLSYTHMPGGWATVHTLLLQCVDLVATEMVKEAQQGRIQVATVLPDGSSLVRH